MSRELYADLTHRAYMERLREELDACLDHIIDAADHLQGDIWHVDSDIKLRTNMQRFQKLHAELGKVQEDDPVQWLKDMKEVSR